MTENEKTLPSYWICSKLGEVCHTTSGGTPSRKNPSFYEGNIPWVKSGELNYNTILETEEHISEDAIKKSSAKVFPKGTLLVALYGATIGKLAILGIEAATNQAVCAIFKNGIFESKFLYYLLFHRRQDLIKEGIGGAQPNISQTILKNLEVPICPLPEQRSIVSKIEQLFSELDNGISNLKLAQEQLKVYRQAVLKKAFEGELTKKWREQQKDLPGAGDLLEEIRKEKEEAAKATGKKVERVKPLTKVELENLSEIPNGWCWTQTGVVCEGIVPGRTKPKKFTGNIPWITIPDVQGFYVGEHSSKLRVTKEDAESVGMKIMPKDTVLMSCVGQFGVICIAKCDIVPNQQFHGFYCSGSILPEYIAYSLKSQIEQMNRLSTATTIAYINKSKCNSILIPLCSLLEQRVIVQEIETRLSVCDKVEQDIEINLEKAEALRQSILKKAFEGKLLNERELAEVRGAEDWESAEVLLERIKAEKVQNGKK